MKRTSLWISSLLLGAFAGCRAPEPVAKDTETAGETFRKLEERIEKAKTIRVRCRYLLDFRREATAQRLEGPSTLLLKEGNKLYLSLKCFEAGTDKEFVIVSDGSQGTWNSGEKWEPVTETPTMLEANLRTLLVRTPITGPMLPACVFWLFTAQLSNDFKALCQVYGLARGQDDGGAKTLTYKLVDWDLREVFKDKAGTEVEAECRTMDVTLWYDPGTLTLLKRKTAFKNELGEGTLTETWEEFAIDDEMPDDRFALPVK